MARAVFCMRTMKGSLHHSGGSAYPCTMDDVANRDLKPRPNRALTLRILRSMTPEAKLRKAFELGRLARDLRAAGIRAREPHLTDDEVASRLARELLTCHNRNS
jgi:hypothetical protein